MPQNATNSESFEWTATKEQAAHLIAEDELTQDQIADQLQVDRTTVYRWRQNREFAAKVRSIVSEIGETIHRKAISSKTRRISAMNRRWVAMQRLIEKRSAELAAYAGGGDTGLLVHRQRMLGSGDNAVLVDEYEFDAGLAKAMLDLEKQAAIELEQWTERKQDVTDPAELRRRFLAAAGTALRFTESAGPAGTDAGIGEAPGLNGHTNGDGAGSGNGTLPG